jgi:4-diphosphocytidyl-2-C-methyl-D-erythritol kinase
MQIQSFAKINLYLEIAGKRPDGYHELISLMCGIDLSDTLRLDFDREETEVICPHPDVPENSSNLAFKAARIFSESSGRDGGGRIFIEKQIPVGAGLGGGSSNAAAVLSALNRHHGYPLSRDALLAAGARIGADVPFFLMEGPAIATGIGDRLEPWTHLTPRPLVLIYPGMPLSTAEVYRKLNFGLTKTKKINRKNTFRRLRKDDTGVGFALRNDLEAPAIDILPEVAEAKQALTAHGALCAQMSGSGSAVFGLYPDGKSARSAHEVLARHNGHWQVYLSRLHTG